MLFDPCFGTFARRRLTSGLVGIDLPEPGLQPEVLEDLTLIALTHGHEDHFDVEGMARLPSRSSLIVVPDPALARRVRRLGFRNVAIPGPWETIPGEGWSLTATPARAPNAWRQISYVLDMGGLRLLHAGDTAAHPWFDDIRERCRPAAGCLPVNGVSLLGLRLTMGPEEAARAAARLRLNLAVPIHHEMRFRRASRLLYRAPGSATAFREAVRRLSPQTRVLLAARGQPATLGPSP